MSTRFTPLVKDRWTKEDTFLLVKSLNLYQGNFKKAAEVVGRPAHECRKKWSTDLRHLTTFPVRSRPRGDLPRVPRSSQGFSTLTTMSTSIQNTEETGNNLNPNNMQGHSLCTEYT
ncbi:3623_t:CDS:2 [Acaulospora morrowiae]|uniref:3623_t:CDS:1 n=1 Tax=Acaulospora morrowiae TaxID=94023 RepID=A0A9N8VCS2_9GLOM|nr:3623_t:CDS:2 [Acaulospora morrowiae]